MLRGVWVLRLAPFFKQQGQRRREGSCSKRPSELKTCMPWHTTSGWQSSSLAALLTASISTECHPQGRSIKHSHYCLLHHTFEASIVPSGTSNTFRHYRARLQTPELQSLRHARPHPCTAETSS